MSTSKQARKKVNVLPQPVEGGFIETHFDETVRRKWDTEKEKWYFVVSDVVQLLADTKKPNDYIKKIRVRDALLSKGWGQIVTPLFIDTKGGRQKMNCADTEGILRILQSIPSKNAEPFKQWLARVGAERIEEIKDPEKAIQRAIRTYEKKGYDQVWIARRLQTIDVRHMLTGEWKKRGIISGADFALLTNEVYLGWSEMTKRDYSKFKQLNGENLRDHMTPVELVLNMLAETSAAEIAKTIDAQGVEQNRIAAKKGGDIAGNARKEIEQNIGKKVITPENNLQKKKPKEL